LCASEGCVPPLVSGVMKGAHEGWSRPPAGAGRASRLGKVPKQSVQGRRASTAPSITQGFPRRREKTMYCTVHTGDYSGCHVTKIPCVGDWKESYLRRVGGSGRAIQAGVRHRGRALLLEKRPDSLLGCAGPLALIYRMGAVACSMGSAAPGAGVSAMTHAVRFTLIESLANFVGGPGSTFTARESRLA